MKLPHFRFRNDLFLVGLTVAVWWSGAVLPRAAAGDLEQLDASVKLVPGDAAFYSSMLRNREIVENILESNAWTKLMNLPVTQLGLKDLRLYAADPQTDLGRFLAAMENPEGQKLLALLCDMGSSEIFVYGDQSAGDFYQFVQNFSNELNNKLMMMRFADPYGMSIQPERLIVRTVLENLDRLVVPDMVIGFKLTDAEAAKEALIKLEALGNAALESAPLMKGHFKKETVGKEKYLVLRLDGKMFPWDQAPLEELEDSGISKAKLDKLAAHIKAMKLVVALGLHGDYLLLSVGSSLKCLENLAPPEGRRLIDRPELKPLEQFTDRKLIGISYVSQSLYQKLNNVDRQLNGMVETVEQVLPLLGLTEEQNERIQNDLEALVADLKSWLPKPVATTAVSYLVPQGVESYQYAWDGSSAAETVEPLSLLRHVGGNPLLGVVGRSKPSLKQYNTLVKWVKTGWSYFKEFGMGTLPDEERETVESFVEDLVPLLKRLDRANREMLFPALEDGQSALVVDAKFTSRQLQAEMPEMEEPMPWPEPALVWSVSDAEKLKRGVGEYYAVSDKFLDLLRKHEPEAIPEDWQLPRPVITKKGEATYYAFPLPEEWGLDRRVRPNAGLTKDVAAVSLTLKTTRRLLKSTPPAVGGVLEDPGKPRSVAAWLNWADALDAARPWIDYALGEIDPSEFDMNVNSLAEQTHAVVDVLKVFRSMTLESYPEEGCTVTHSRMEIRDIPEE
ncbi:MAG: hypothetical protein JXB10_11335 [Pirellulales bacterium]|nr:hypothetical protein [Pirellulales bacterium]